MILFFKILFRGIYHFLTNPNQRRFMWLVFRYGDIDRYKNKLIRVNGFKLIVPDCLSFIWQYKEIFVDESYSFKTDDKTVTIIDCGANIGLGLLHYKINHPDSRIIAFEANPQITEILIKNIEANGLNNIEIHNKAVWVDERGVELSLENADGSSIYGSGKRIKIPSVSLRSILEQEQKVDFLKIDIEGAEVEVIKNCADTLSKASNIFIEYHSFINEEQRLNEVLTTLTQNKFRYFIKPVNDRRQPLINKKDSNFPQFDLQLNIYAYKD